MQDSYLGAFIFIVLAAVFDFLDGFAARMLKSYSEMGKELDSLADVVSFGLAPGLLVFTFLQQTAVFVPWGSDLRFIAFLIPVFSAVRLARFNLDTRQSVSFLGLPVPANALFWGALIPSLQPHIPGNEFVLTLLVSGLVLLFCFLLVSEIPLCSMKFSHYRWRGNEQRYLLILTAIVLISCFRLPGVSLTVCAYLLMSVKLKVASG
jgi:CDP-diacylglycerol--serine O-phosphatidyltransferase